MFLLPQYEPFHFRPLKDQGEILQKNMFARKKASELLGIDESVLARSIQKREALVKLGAEELMNLKADEFEAALSQLETMTSV